MLVIAILVLLMHRTMVRLGKIQTQGTRPGLEQDGMRAKNKAKEKDQDLHLDSRPASGSLGGSR